MKPDLASSNARSLLRVSWPAPVTCCSSVIASISSLYSSSSRNWRYGGSVGRACYRAHGEGEFKRTSHLLWCTEATTPPRGEGVARRQVGGGFGSAAISPFQHAILNKAAAGLSHADDKMGPPYATTGFRMDATYSGRA
jgi:hypothetical protein